MIRSDLSISAISCTNYTSQKYAKDIDVSSVVCCFLRTQFHTLCTSVHHCAFLQPLRDACDAFQGYPGFWVMLLHCLREVSEATGIHGVTQDPPETTGMSSRKLDESPQRGLTMRYNEIWVNKHCNVLDVGRILQIWQDLHVFVSLPLLDLSCPYCLDLAQLRSLPPLFILHRMSVLWISRLWPWLRSCSWMLKTGPNLHAKFTQAVMLCLLCSFLKILVILEMQQRLQWTL